jgi:hypothetical protein
MKNKIEHLIKELCFKYNIRDIIEVPKGKIECNALFYGLSGSYSILLDETLPFLIKKFSTIHEIGHIALGHINKRPFQDWDQKIETEINLWSLEKIKLFLPKNEDINLLKETFVLSETKGLQLLNQIKM